MIQKVIVLGDLFEGLEKFGLQGLQEMDLFPAPKKAEQENIKVETKKEFVLGEYVFLKSFTCPACENQFKENSWRTKKGRLIGIDYDLRPLYEEPVHPMFYDVVICPRCGYAAISQSFNTLAERQAQAIREVITPKYTHVDYPELLDADMAIERYKLALLSCVVKKAKDGEKAYICMKLAWLYRSKGDAENELSFIARAYDGFQAALTGGTLPVCGMDSDTLMYLIAAYAKTLKKYDESMRILSKLITSRTINPRIKERSLDLKEEIKAIQEKAKK